MTVSRFSALFLGVFLYSTVAAAEWTEVSKIDTLKVQHNGLVVATLEGFSSGSSVSCSNDYFVMSSNADHYDSRLSMLMTAYTAGSPVRFSYNECYGNSIKLRAVQMR